MKYTLEKLEKMMQQNGGSLDLRNTGITALPDNLTVGGSLDLRGTNITALPDNLTVGGSLDLSGTNITALPDNLTVGGWLDLSNTNITALPDNLTVGGWLYLSGTNITDTSNIKRLKEDETVYRPGEWLYTDGILTHVKRKKKIGIYTYFIGKIPNKNVIFDGENYAHCKDFKSGITDLAFKRLKNRGQEQFNDLTLDSIVSKDMAIAMYRIITGACQAGTQQFLDTIKEFKEEYSVAEIIEITQGQYGSSTFAEFFKKAVDTE